MEQTAAWMPHVPNTAPQRIAESRRNRAAQRACDRRRRALARVALFILAAAVILSAILPTMLVTRTPRAAHARQIRVQAGESLWDIAARSQVPGQSTQDALAQIRALNDLEDSLILEGALLLVPVSDQHHVASR